MCGIAGFLNPNRTLEKPEEALGRMTAAISYRGPDDYGHWFDPDTGVALGHRRLSILDLSPEGRQPMRSACGRYVIVYNGEIYNFQELRRELEGNSKYVSIEWRGSSDTEVLLAACSKWGVEASLKRFVGMFAFALWDQQERILYLVRDRVGEKPLYYGWSGDTFLFGSELKALRAHPAFRAVIDRDAISLLLRHNCIPAPYSIYQGISKLPPGSLLKVPLLSLSENRSFTPTPYWSAKELVESGVANPFAGSEDEAVETLNDLLLETVRHQMVADVPLGAFLSGGVDSSSIAALMQAQSSTPVKTFTIGFEEASYNEAEYAKAVAAHLGTEHTELYVSPQEAMDVIPRLPMLYDEPFSDSSQIPTFLVAQMTARHVKVSLSGDGGDELFGGYNQYFSGHLLLETADRLPKALRRSIANGLDKISPEMWDKILGTVTSLLPKGLRLHYAGYTGGKINKLSDILRAKSTEEMYYERTSHWRAPTPVIRGAHEPTTIITDTGKRPNIDNFIQKMMYFDLVSYLTDDILVKVDRAAMGVSLETRVPFLDHRIIEFAWQLPLSMKIRDTQGKWILRQVLHKYVPKQLIERPKSGFAIPLDSWLRGPLREWAESLLEEKRLKDEGFLDPIPIRQKWSEFLSGKGNWQYCLWDVLMFQAWLENAQTIITR